MGSSSGLAAFALGHARWDEMADAVVQRVAAVLRARAQRLAQEQRRLRAEILPGPPSLPGPSACSGETLGVPSGFSPPGLALDRVPTLEPPLFGARSRMFYPHCDELDGTWPNDRGYTSGPRPPPMDPPLYLLVERDPAKAPKGLPPIFLRPPPLPGERFYHHEDGQSSQGGKSSLGAGRVGVLRVIQADEAGISRRWARQGGDTAATAAR